jgi:peptidoglycan/LPS O-acetylase OafA/YrhL
MCVIILIGIGDLYHLSYVFESFIIVYLTLNSRILISFFSSKPLVFLGKISFSLYLIHILVICSFTCFLYLQLSMLTNEIRIIVSTLISLVFLILLSYIYTITIDSFALKASSKIGKYFLK